MTTIGFIENRIRPNPRPLSDLYINIYSFLSSSIARNIGITQVAFNTGVSGLGMGYTNESNKHGENSFAVFKFASASNPFYLLMQYSSGNTIGGTNYFGSSFAGAANMTASLYGNGDNAVGIINQVTPNWTITSGAVAFAIAQRLDGGNPWNGTTNNTGGDTKGNPVWISGSSSGSLIVWPRSNGQTGTFDYPNRRHNMMGFATFVEMNNKDSKMSVLADQNNFFVTLDVGNSGSYRSFYFGKYNARPGLNPQIPYVCLSTTGSGQDPPFFVRPHRFGRSDGRAEEGGACHPAASFGVRSCGLDYLRTFLTSTQMHPNTMFTFPHKVDQYQYFLLLDEDPSFYGYLGTIDFFRLVNGVMPTSVNKDKTYVAFGANRPHAVKLLVPWDSASPAGTGGNRRGRQF